MILLKNILRFFSFLIVNLFVLQQSCAAETLPTLNLTPGVDVADVSTHIRYKIPYERDVDFITLTNEVDDFESLKTSNIHFGIPNGKILILLKLKNNSDLTGSWILTTGRGSLKYFKMFELSSEADKILLDGTISEDVKKNLRSYQSFSHDVTLQPQETKLYAIHFEAEGTSSLPLKIQTSISFFQARQANIALVASTVACVLILILVNALFFWMTAKPEFLWLAAAEFVFALNTLHTEGYMTIYWLYDTPLLRVAFGDVVKCAFAACMAQVARSFLQTKENFSKTDLFLKILIGSCIAIIIAEFGAAYYSTEIKALLHSLSWFMVAFSALYLPFVAIIAVRRFGIHYWPLIPAWGSLGVFIIYVLIATAGIIPGLSFNFHIGGPVGLFEGAMTTLVLGLHVKKIQSERRATDQKLNDSLREQLAAKEKAKALAEERAAALAALSDQNSILHSTGHDSRQVVLALNSAIEHLETNHKKGNQDTADLQALLRSSATYLNDIIATSMSNANMLGEKVQTLLLSKIEIHDLARSLTQIYLPIFRDKGLSFEIVYPEDLVFISDKALLLRVISNIVSNSLKFTDDGGVKLSVFIKKQNVVFNIEDTGVGIETSLLSQLNNDQKHTDVENYIGLGSGLQFSRDVVSQLGGDLIVDSNMKRLSDGTKNNSQGTSVKINIPYYELTRPVSLDVLQAHTPDLKILDYDQINNETDLASKKAKVAVTYDHRATTRLTLSKRYSLIFQKPLYVEMLQHSAVKQLL